MFRNGEEKRLPYLSLVNVLFLVHSRLPEQSEQGLRGSKLMFRMNKRKLLETADCCPDVLGAVALHPAG